MSVYFCARETENRLIDSVREKKYNICKRKMGGEKESPQSYWG